MKTSPSKDSAGSTNRVRRRRDGMHVEYLGESFEIPNELLKAIDELVATAWADGRANANMSEAHELALKRVYRLLSDAQQA